MNIRLSLDIFSELEAELCQSVAMATRSKCFFSRCARTKLWTASDHPSRLRIPLVECGLMSSGSYRYPLFFSFSLSFSLIFFYPDIICLSVGRTELMKESSEPNIFVSSRRDLAHASQANWGTSHRNPEETVCESMEKQRGITWHTEFS